MTFVKKHIFHHKTQFLYGPFDNSLLVGFVDHVTLRLWEGKVRSKKRT